MDIGKSFTYVFQDKDWLGKVLIGSLILLVSFPLTIILVGFLGFAVVGGYSLEVLRNVRQGSAKPLPEWRDRWSEWLVLGLKLLVVLLAWSLPSLLLNIPSAMGSSMVDSGSALLGVMGSGLVAGAALLSFLWTLVVLLVTPVLCIRLAETEDVVSAFQFREIYQFVRDHVGDVVIAALIALAASIVLGLLGWTVGALLCLVGLVITVPASLMLTSLVSAHLYGQIGLAKPGRSEVITPEVVK